MITIMKKLFYIVVVAILALGLTSCEKQSAGLTRITYYAQIELNGDETMQVARGSEFVDPGYVATMNGQDVTAQVEVTSNVNTAKSGVYAVNYSIVNADGFPTSSERKVIVVNKSSAVEGWYKSDASSYNVNNNSGKNTPYDKSFDILIFENEDGTYTVDDLLAGWYAQRRGDGPVSAMQGQIAVADDGTITLLDSYIENWGDGLDAMENGKFDASTKTITYKVSYAGFLDFYVTLNKVEF